MLNSLEGIEFDLDRSVRIGQKGKDGKSNKDKLYIFTNLNNITLHQIKYGQDVFCDAEW